MKCPYCNGKINDSSLFCPTCGKEVIRNKKCPKCGHLNSLNSSFCEKCGTQLPALNLQQNNVVNKSKQTHPVKNGLNTNGLRVLSIIAMALMLSVLSLMALSVFFPYYSDSFYPVRDFTIIGRCIDSFSYMGDVSTNNKYVEIVCAFIALALLTATFIVLLILLIRVLVKMIKAINDRKFIDFSKSVVTSLVLYILLFIFTTKYVFQKEMGYDFSVNGWHIFLIVLTSIALVFNFVVSELNENEYVRVSTVILESVFRTFIFASILTIIFLLGSVTFDIKGSFSSTSFSFYLTANTNSLGTICYFEETSHYMIEETLPFLTRVYVNSTVSCILELLIIFFIILLVKDLFCKSIKDSINCIKGIVFSSIALFFEITVIILYTSINKNIEGCSVGSNKYNSILASSVNYGPVVTALVFTIVLLALSITLLVIRKSARRRGL